MGRLKKLFLIILSLLFVTSMQSCEFFEKIPEVFTGGDKISFCVKYTPNTDNCEGRGNIFKAGKVTVLIELSEGIGVDEALVNITNEQNGSIVNTMQYTVGKSLKKIYFPNIDFPNPGKFKVSILTPEGNVVVSDVIEITL